MNFSRVIDNVRVQWYVVAANMSGIHRGVQARIRERIPTAQLRTSYGTCFKLSYCTFVIRCISKGHDGYHARNRIRLPIIF